MRATVCGGTVNPGVFSGRVYGDLVEGWRRNCGHSWADVENEFLFINWSMVCPLIESSVMVFIEPACFFV